ncbi:hypothetical protein ACRAWF_31095 [Streptomyces sp. L7]
MSTSTLHRYCNGDAVPTEYAPVERFARLCKATPDELVEAHRRWILADGARQRERKSAATVTTTATPTATPTPTAVEAATAPTPEADLPAPARPRRTGDRARPAQPPPHRPLRRRGGWP